MKWATLGGEWFVAAQVVPGRTPNPPKLQG